MEEIIRIITQDHGVKALTVHKPTKNAEPLVLLHLKKPVTDRTAFVTSLRQRLAKIPGLRLKTPSPKSSMTSFEHGGKHFNITSPIMGPDEGSSWEVRILSSHIRQLNETQMAELQDHLREQLGLD